MRGRVSVLVDKVPHDFVQHAGPALADGVDFGDAVDGDVCVVVGGQAGRVELRSDAGGGARHPLADGVVLRPRVALLKADGGGHGIGPAFTHTTRLGGGQTA